MGEETNKTERLAMNILETLNERYVLTTAQIEQRFDLFTRLKAIETFVHAKDYLKGPKAPERDFQTRTNALELLNDGIKNALDGRATGFEWRTLRHRYNEERDGPIPPIERDRRCQLCGAVDPEPFTDCSKHRTS